MGPSVVKRENAEDLRVLLSRFRLIKYELQKRRTLGYGDHHFDRQKQFTSCGGTPNVIVRRSTF